MDDFGDLKSFSYPGHRVMDQMQQVTWETALGLKCFVENLRHGHSQMTMIKWLLIHIYMIVPLWIGQLAIFFAIL